MIVCRRPVDDTNNWNRIACDISTQADNHIQRLMSLKEVILSNLAQADLLIEEERLNISGMKLISWLLAG